MNDISIAQDFDVTGDVVIIQDAAAIILSPDQGPPGARGNGVLSGEGPPNSSIGLDGDFYVDGLNNMIYGPKANGIWPPGQSMEGTQGPPGPPGPQGAPSTVPGPVGPPGAKGDKGDQGLQGAPGAASSVPGPQGPQGLQGIPGVKGDKGDQGAASTVPGPQGPQGSQGTKGDKGDTGTKGDTGVAGPPGPSTVTVSDTAPAGVPDNTIWWESDTGLLYVKYNDGTSTQWVIACPQPDISMFALKTDLGAYLPTTGGTLTGALALAGAPATAAQAANKGYVDTAIAALVPVIRNYLTGLTLSTPGASTSFTVGPGTTADSTNVAMLALNNALTKTTAAWALGSGAGALDTGVIAPSTCYHVFLIQRVDTKGVSVLISLSPTAPTLPSPYTLFRRIGALLTNASSQWTPFIQLGDEFIFVATINDVNVTNLGTAAQLLALSVPTGVQVNALGRASVFHASAAGVGVLVQPPDQNAEAVNNVPGNTSITGVNTSSSGRMAMNIRTNASGQIRAVSTNANTTLQWNTYGYIDRRGRDAA